jgi:fructose-1,6-bisphosphatase I
MAFLVEKGGGRAITGRGSVLDLQPRRIHERSAIFLGSKQDIDRIEALYQAA